MDSIRLVRTVGGEREGFLCSCWVRHRDLFFPGSPHTGVLIGPEFEVSFLGSSPSQPGAIPVSLWQSSPAPLTHRPTYLHKFFCVPPPPPAPHRLLSSFTHHIWPIPQFPLYSTPFLQSGSAAEGGTTVGIILGRKFW
ncbi:hypothetical protein ASPVEDRAFT_624401 [Aspergillus versicolor CBS 583.65]|uniref:Uncharacterized protein n=1 Tax=Aspergillus versicolor CBS 583.65 TaxID=1036611 RepID=A0A1L9PI85_ASPVE|nr:uncharacterized protein ASPVEDRAFT_624401 [Aspergillus versicolor CBS 583.65]OJJ01244.1 hypothetical protein ASPVEDRAFT_624401 [Aspergillus versicolor CBS 583.65]